MDARRLKSIILGVLLAANIALALVLAMRSYEGYRSEQTAIDNTISALSGMGMSVDRKLLTADYPTLYPTEVERSLLEEIAFAETLVGSGTLTESGSGMYELVGPNGVAHLSDVGRIAVELDYEIPWQDECYSAIGLDPEDFDRGRHQLISGAPVLNVSAGIYGSEQTVTLPTGSAQKVGTVTRIDGSVLFGDVYVTDSTPSKSLSAALLVLAAYLDDAGTPAGTIGSASIGWAADRAAPGYTRLEPTWLIATENAGSFLVDAMTLSVSAAAS